MTKSEITPVELIIPDAGPLISLAHADQLDLVHIFGRRVAIADVVMAECLKKPSSPDHEVLKQWFERNANSVQTITTPFAQVFNEALQREIDGLERNATRGLGDATVTWILQNLDRVAETGVIPLVLTEDRTFSLDLTSGGKAHVLSTRAWLAGLEEAGAIESAANLLRAMGQHGRSVSNLNIDHPIVKNDATSDWIENVNPAFTIETIRGLLKQPLKAAATLQSGLEKAPEFTKQVARSVIINIHKRDSDANTIALIALAAPSDRDFVSQIAILRQNIEQLDGLDQYLPTLQQLSKNEIVEANSDIIASLKRHGATSEFTDGLDRELAEQKARSR